jgi:hypothetical protein
MFIPEFDFLISKVPPGSTMSRRGDHSKLEVDGVTAWTSALLPTLANIEP